MSTQPHDCHPEPRCDGCGNLAEPGYKWCHTCRHADPELCPECDADLVDGECEACADLSPRNGTVCDRSGRGIIDANGRCEDCGRWH